MLLAAMLGLAIAAYAYSQNTSAVPTASASCCKKSDSCPMKGSMNHGDAGGEQAKMSCCKKHGEHTKADGSTADCCGDSCPMKSGDAAHTADGKNCCDDCVCCNDKAKSDS